MELKEAILRINEHKDIHCKTEYPRAIKITEALNIAINALKKQIPQKANIGYDNSIDIGEEPNNNIYLECPTCNTCVGEIIDEDADGELKYNIYEKYCSSCGQAIEQIYTNEDYKKWGI